MREAPEHGPPAWLGIGILVVLLAIACVIVDSIPF
jgi:hypothetical protein